MLNVWCLFWIVCSIGFPQSVCSVFLFYVLTAWKLLDNKQDLEAKLKFWIICWVTFSQ